MSVHATRTRRRLASARRRTQRPVRKLVPLMLSWFSANARDLPWRRTRDPYAIWVSEIMLQQTQVKTVIPYWKRWMRELPTIEAVAKASPAKLHKLWEGLGYYTRVRNLQKAAQRIVAERHGQFPRNFDDILALPGIGRYTAGAICSIAFNQPTPILDGNVIRVLTRIFGVTTNPREKQTNEQLWQWADALVHHASGLAHHQCACSQLNQSLMELGALICTSRSPDCPGCPVKGLCVARREGKQETLPNLGQRNKTTERRFIAFIVERQGKFLVRQRPEGVVNAHLWEFPNFEVGARPSGPQRVGRHKNLTKSGLPSRLEAQRPERLRSGFGHFVPAAAKPFCTIKHSITRYRITLEAWRADLGTRGFKKPAPQSRWLSSPQLEKLAFSSAHKKILRALQSKIV